MTHLVTLLLAVAIVAPSAMAGEIYRYRLADGTLCFTDAPRRPGDRPAISLTRRLTTVATPFHSRRHPFAATVRRAATDTGLAADLLHAVIATESGYDPRARSPKGAMGLMQLMPATARDLGVEDPYDPEENIYGGARYLRTLWDRFGDLTLALAAYNAGPDRVVQYGGVPPFPETRTYLRRLRTLYPEGDWHHAAGDARHIYRVRLAGGEVLYTNVAP